MKNTPFNIIVKSSKIDGKGLFAMSPIPGRKKIGELAGEIISVAKARKIARAHKRIAIVELDYKYALDASCIDGKLKYINHSCTPNAYMRVIKKRVEFYALKDIAVNEEITCRYGETHHDGNLKCTCNAASCNRYL